MTSSNNKTSDSTVNDLAPAGPAGLADTEADGEMRPETERAQEPRAIHAARDDEEVQPGSVPSPKPDARPTPMLVDVRVSPRLTKDELIARVCLGNDGLVEEIHALVLRQNQSEDQRETRLDGKAQGLLGAASLSLTFALGVGGLLLNDPGNLSPLGGWRFLVIVLYAIALALGLFAAIWAGRALYVTADYQTVSDDNAFNAAELDAIERDAAGDPVVGRTLYRRYIVVQLWQIYRKHFDIHEGKADLIRNGQRLFLVFLGILLVVALFLAHAAIKRHGLH